MKNLKRVALLLAVCLCLLSGGVLQASGQLWTALRSQ